MKAYFYDNKFLKDLSIIYLLNIIFLIIFYNFSGIDMECDTSLSYMVGRTIHQVLFGGSYDAVMSFRPPGYPIFLMLSGVYFFESFWAIIIAHSILTFISLGFIYYSFNLYKRFYAIAFSITYILLFFLYTHIKGTAEMHLVNTLIVISVCSLIIFLKKEKIFFYYLSILSIIYAVFTRGDTAPLLITVFICANLILFKLKKKFKNFFIISLIIFLTFFIWTVSKGLFFYYYGNESELRNKKIFVETFISLSFNHQEGAQKFWRVQNYDRPNLNELYSTNIKNYLDLNNGPRSKELYEVLTKAFKTPHVVEKILKWKGRMLGLGEDDVKIDTWEKYYGEIKYNPKKIVDRIFDKNFESYYYPDQLREILAMSITRVKGDKLLQDVSNEIISKNQNLQKVHFESFIRAYGFRFNPIKNTINFEHQPNGIYLFNIDSFNAGNCPKIALPTKMYKEYLYEYEERSVLKNDNSKNFRDFVYYSRDKLRNVLGIISILSVLMLIFYKERLIPIFLNLSFIFSNMLVSNYVPPTGKVENYLLSLAVFNAFYFIIFIKEKNFFLKKI
jgi:hypothetical protein